MSDREGLDTPSGETDRRTFLGNAALTLAGLLSVGAAAVAIVYAAAPALRRSARDEGWSAIPDAGGSRGAAPSRHSVSVVSDAGWAESRGKYAIFLDATAAGAPVAFSARCPHEGCQVEWREERSIYVCPCHDSSWSRDGERLGGPTRRGLDPLDVRVADGVVEVRYETFAHDTSERTPVA